ncbi:hypothetical protein Dimus_027009 [Dionaea muscipula]
MKDNGLSNVIDLIKRKKWEKLFKRRELMHIDAVKEFYARLILVHYKKKDVARSSVRGVDIEFDHQRLASILGVPGHNGICSGENRRRDDEEVALAEAVNEEEQNQEFDWEAVVDEAALQGESGSDDQFYDAQVEAEEPDAEAPAVPVFPALPGDSTNQQKEPEAAGVDPSGPPGHIPDSIMIQLQADF